MIRIFCATRIEAQSLCDKIHQQMIATNPAYAKSVADGRTKKWADPRRDVDELGNEVGQYFVPLKDRVEGVLTPIEKGRVIRDGKVIEKAVR